jgi:hypothetical protein
MDACLIESTVSNVCVYACVCVCVCVCVDVLFLICVFARARVCVCVCVCWGEGGVSLHQQQGMQAQLWSSSAFI